MLPKVTKNSETVTKGYKKKFYQKARRFPVSD